MGLGTAGWCSDVPVTTGSGHEDGGVRLVDWGDLIDRHCIRQDELHVGLLPLAHAGRHFAKSCQQVRRTTPLCVHTPPVGHVTTL